MSILAIGVGAAMLINKAVDYFGYKKSSQYKTQLERDERLAELQHRQHLENQMFQARRDAKQQAFQWQRDGEQRRFQMEMEANRMAFQERIEMRRLQVQKQLEKEKADLTIALNKMNIRNSRDIARFNAMAMRETQILVARENAQNLLQDRMIQDALKNFPLNISPLVLLKNRPHSLASLLRFTVAFDGEAPQEDVVERTREASNNKDVVEYTIEDVANDVMDYAKNPEALNVFVAPVYVDSKIKNREILSKQIWDTTYQQLESFFTEYYNRRSERPVIFYPTAWNDKYSSGMHASETLHFFLRDMPCVVLEPRFDGNNFRVMVSLWGLGYTSTDHIRTELNFDINIDAVLAYSVYERSKTALSILNDLIEADIAETEKTPFIMQQRILNRNVKIYESLRINERINNKQLNEIDALGIYNIFKIEPVQDLSLLSNILSAQIGLALATLTDIHHLHSTGAEPIFPTLMNEKKMFQELFDNPKICEALYKSYRDVILHLLEEEKQMLSLEDGKLLEYVRNGQLEKIKDNLRLKNNESCYEELKEQISGYCDRRFKFKSDDFDEVWYHCLDNIDEKDKAFFDEILPLVENEDKKKYNELKKVLLNLNI